MQPAEELQISIPRQKLLAIIASPVSRKKGASAPKGPVGIGDAALPLPFTAESWFIASLKPQSQLSPSSCPLGDDFSCIMQMQHTGGQQVRAVCGLMIQRGSIGDQGLQI